MSNKNRLYLILCVFASLCSTSLFGQILQYENQPIEKIEVEAENFPSGVRFEPYTVLSHIRTRSGDFFSQLMFDNDLKTLSQEYDRVEPFLASVDGKLFIKLKIWPKPTIRCVTWVGNQKVKSKRLQKELEISLGSVFDRQAFNKAFHKLKAYYVKKGFFEATLDYNVALDSDTNEVDITINIDEGRAGRIKDIVFTNFTPEEEDEILEQLITKKYCIFTSWLTDEGTYNEDAVQQDQFTILSYLQNQGYADARVDLEVCEAEESNRIIIYITATKGPLYQFGEITFSGNKIFCDEDIRDLFTICEEGPYSPERLNETRQNITRFYGKRGYIEAYVDYEPKLLCDELAYTVNFTIEEGEQYCVGLIKVFGNCSTQTNVILHETLLVPGEVFNMDKLQLTEEKLRNIGYFKNVNVYFVKSEGPYGLGGCYRDVHIEVEETSTGNFGAGFGFSSVESIFGEFRITEKNFNYQGFSHFWEDGYKALRGGGEYVHIGATIGAKSRRYALSWTKPFFNDTPWVVGFEIEQSNNRYVSKDYDIDSAGITIHGTRPVNQFINLGLHYRLRNTHIQINEGHPSTLLKEEARNSGLISAVGISLNYDSTNHPSEPTDGFKSRLEEEFAGVWGDHTYLSLAYLNSFYYPVSRRGTIRLRGDARFIVPMCRTEAHDIPIDERLFLGGDTTVRGYRSYKLGPKYPEGDPRGGMSLQFLSAEYDHKLSKRFSAFVFCDAGHLAFGLWDFGELRTSLGFGVRFKVFESGPPLNLGMGFPLNPRSRGDVKRFFFAVGGRF